MTDLSHTPRTRTAAALVGVLTWAALLVQFALSMRAAASGGNGVLFGIARSLRYFTVLTNLGVALALTVPLVAPASAAGRFFRSAGTLTGLAASILLVGIVYHVALRRPWHSLGPAVAADFVLHYAAPVLFAGFWWYAVPKATLSWRDAFRWCAYPLAYFVYVLARGAVSGIYPYPFLDAGALGYATVLANGVGLLVAFAVISLVLVAAGRVASRGTGTARGGEVG